MLRGACGVGKTELLRHAIGRARGMTVLFARGLEAETQLAFAALADVLRPILGLLDEIPDPQATALAGALGLGPAVAVDRFVMCAATLSLLSAAASRQPVLVAVDDWRGSTMPRGRRSSSLPDVSSPNVSRFSSPSPRTPRSGCRRRASTNWSSRRRIATVASSRACSS